MVRTPEDVKKGSELCAEYGNCAECPYRHYDWASANCKRVLAADSLEYINLLEAKDGAGQVSDLAKQLVTIRRDRDEAVRILFLSGVCNGCIHDSSPVPCKHRLICRRTSPNDPDGKTDKWQWRGATSQKEVSPDA